MNPPCMLEGIQTQHPTKKQKRRQKRVRTGYRERFRPPTLAWLLLTRSEAATLSAPLALTVALPLALTGAGAGKPGSAGRPMAVAAMPLVATLSGAAAWRAAAGSHPIVAAATATAKLVANVVAAPAGLADREVGGPPFFLVTFDARQRGAYQLAMHGTVLDVRHALVVILVEAVAVRLIEVVVTSGACRACKASRLARRRDRSVRARGERRAQAG